MMDAIQRLMKMKQMFWNWNIHLELSFHHTPALLDRERKEVVLKGLRNSILQREVITCFGE